jgi:hypothetical protein
MRTATRLTALSLVATLAACNDVISDFDADFKQAKSNVASLEGGAFDHQVQQRLQAQEVLAAANQCVAQNRPDRKAYRGVVAFDGSRGYDVRFEAGDDLADCLVDAYEGRALPEPPARPYLVPLEVDAAR